MPNQPGPQTGSTPCDPRYGPFGAARDASPVSQAELAAFVAPGDQVWPVEPEQWPTPPGMRTIHTARLLQMVAEQPEAIRADDPAAAPLAEADAEAMAELALATEPGPWSALTRLYDPFMACTVMAGWRLWPEHGCSRRLDCRKYQGSATGPSIAGNAWPAC